MTGKDAAHLAPMPVNRLMPDMRVPPHPILAEEPVHATGMPVAAVVAEDVYAAYDALDLIEVDYEPLPALPEPEAPWPRGAPALFPGIDGNRVLTRTLREGDAAGAFAPRRPRGPAAGRADPHLRGGDRAALGRWPPSTASTDELTMWVSCQAPFRIRGEVARLLELPESRVRVIAPDVGGGFGVKTGPYREDVLLAWLARDLGRPVKWVATRREDQVTTNQARGSVCEGELALDASGRITGLRARITSPLGSSLMNAAAGTAVESRAAPARRLRRAEPATSRSPARSPPPRRSRPIAGRAGRRRRFFIERLMDEAARGLGLDPAEIRRRNFIPPARFPYRTVTGQVYDSGDYPLALDRALEAADYAGLRREQDDRSARAARSSALASRPTWSPARSAGRAAASRSSARAASPPSPARARTGRDTRPRSRRSSPITSASRPTRSRCSRRHALRPGGLRHLRQPQRGPRRQRAGARSVELRDKGRRIAAQLLEAAPEDILGVRRRLSRGGIARPSA